MAASGGRAALLAVALVAATSAGCQDAKPRRHDVTIRAFQYEPATLKVAVGDTVVWLNEDVVPHTATAADAGWDSGSIGSRGSARVVIRRKGAQSYLCAFHPNMRAELSAE